MIELMWSGYRFMAMVFTAVVLILWAVGSITVTCSDRLDFWCSTAIVGDEG